MHKICFQHIYFFHLVSYKGSIHFSLNGRYNKLKRKFILFGTWWKEIEGVTYCIFSRTFLYSKGKPFFGRLRTVLFLLRVSFDISESANYENMSFSAIVKNSVYGKKLQSKMKTFIITWRINSSFVVCWVTIPFFSS